MKKLKLNLDDLKVESFATTPEPSGKPGTVYGQDTDVGLGCGTDDPMYCTPGSPGFGTGGVDVTEFAYQCYGANYTWVDTCSTCDCGTNPHHAC